MIKILIVDDHELVLSGFAHMLSKQEGIKVAGQCSSGEEAVKFVRSVRPDVVLMDVKMPGMGGLQATKKILEIDKDIKVVALTALDDELFSTRMFQAGAVGYLTKGADLDQVSEAIHLVVAGQKYIPETIARQLALKRINKTGEGSPFEKLSERELQITLMICGGEKAQEIAEILFLSPKTVNSYRYRVFDKLDIQSDVELVFLALKHNLVDIETTL